MTEVYYPSILTNTNAFPANIMFTFYERSSTTQSEIQDIVHLYMPENFSQPSTVSWDHQFSGGEALINAASGAANLVKDQISSWRNSRCRCSQLAVLKPCHRCKNMEEQLVI